MTGAAGAGQLPDPATPFGARVRDRLRDERLAWLTTVAADGTPQPNPVWFLWDEQAGTVLVYSAIDARRQDHIRQRPRVSLSFQADEHGDDVVVLLGHAHVADDVPPPQLNAAYLAKYREAMAEVSGDVERFAQEYRVPVVIVPDRVRGFL